MQEMLRHACSVRGPRAHMMLPLLCSDSLHMQATYAVAALAAAAHGGDLPLAPTQALLSAVEGPDRWAASALRYAPVRLLPCVPMSTCTQAPHVAARMP